MKVEFSFKATICWILLVLSMVSSGACSENQQGSEQAKASRGQLRDLVKSLDRKIEFYGRVLDQFDRPVDGALVSMGTRHFSIISPMFFSTKNLEVSTDHGGFFEVLGYRGSDLFIGKISKDGYEYLRSQNPENSFDYGGTVGPLFVADKVNPVVFRMRRRLQNRTFLFENMRSGIQVLRKESGLLKGIDFVEGMKSRMPGERPRDTRSKNCDLFYRAAYNEKSGEWHVILKPGGSEGGILVSDQMLYVSPEDGYQEEWSFVPVEHRIPNNRFIYLKSRLPAIYTRLEVIGVVVTDGFVRIRWKRVTNPYGDRVLDSVDFPPYSTKPEIERIYQVGDRLEEEAKAALREGRLPPRPKIMALIEAAKRGD